ncbi:RHS repeat-associated core domain-containing protein [Saccharothrix isguenensis]
MLVDAAADGSRVHERFEVLGLSAGYGNPRHPGLAHHRRHHGEPGVQRLRRARHRRCHHQHLRRLRTPHRHRQQLPGLPGHRPDDHLRRHRPSHPYARRDPARRQAGRHHRDRRHRPAHRPRRRRQPATGEVTGSRTYSPFGAVQASAGTQPGLGYQHQWTDPATGNVNMGARWYQPGTGTFASRDTAALDPPTCSTPTATPTRPPIPSPTQT